MRIQKNIEKLRLDAAIRKATTIGQLERLAGIETNADRALFWRQFAALKNRAAKAGKAELVRLIRENYRYCAEDSANSLTGAVVDLCLKRFILNFCDSAAAFLPSSVLGRRDRTLLASAF